jgi:hypothetical protein
MLPLSLLVSISLLALLDMFSWPLYTLIVVVVNIGLFFNWCFNDAFEAQRCSSAGASFCDPLKELVRRSLLVRNNPLPCCQ